MEHESAQRNLPPGDEISSARIVDANANRAEEGLRVIEEFFRFAVEDAHLAESFKVLRHTLVQELSQIDRRTRSAARDTRQDIGTALSAGDEYERQSLTHCWSANVKRVGQSLRCIEEYLKVLQPSLAARIECLRYELYTLDRAGNTLLAARARLDKAHVYVLIDGGESPEDFAQRVQVLVEGGTDVIQLRDKQLSDRSLLERARQLRQLTVDSTTRCIVNDRPDIAALSRADGVHLGQDELSVKDARSIVGAQPLIGVSTHTLAQAREAVLDGADYIGCGPTFPSQTKSFSEFAGLEFLQQVAAEIGLPAFAIGGITPTNIQEVMDCGFKRVAVSAAVTKAAQPAEVVRKLKEMLRK